jgi:hypothetical protein
MIETNIQMKNENPQTPKKPKNTKMKNKPTNIKVTANRILPGVTVCSSPLLHQLLQTETPAIK